MPLDVLAPQIIQITRIIIIMIEIITPNIILPPRILRDLYQGNLPRIHLFAHAVQSVHKIAIDIVAIYYILLSFFTLPLFSACHIRVRTYEIN